MKLCAYFFITLSSILFFNVNAKAYEGKKCDLHLHSSLQNVYSPYGSGHGYPEEFGKKLEKILSQDKGFSISNEDKPKVGDYGIVFAGQENSTEICHVKIALIQITKKDSNGKNVRLIETYSAKALGLDLLDSPSEYCLFALKRAVKKVKECRDIQ
jgi:hypothetical protein